MRNQKTSVKLSQIAEEVRGKIPRMMVDSLNNKNLESRELKIVWKLVGELNGKNDWPAWGSRDLIAKLGIRSGRDPYCSVAYGGKYSKFKGI